MITRSKIYPSYISKVINGKLKSTYGFKFKKLGV